MTSAENVCAAAGIPAHAAAFHDEIRGAMASAGPSRPRRMSRGDWIVVAIAAWASLDDDVQSCHAVSAAIGAVTAEPMRLDTEDVVSALSWPASADEAPSRVEIAQAWEGVMALLSQQGRGIEKYARALDADGPLWPARRQLHGVLRARLAAHAPTLISYHQWYGTPEAFVQSWLEGNTKAAPELCAARWTRDCTCKWAVDA